MPMKPAFDYSSLIKNSFRNGIKGRLLEKFFAMLPKILCNKNKYIWIIHKSDVIKNMIPKISFKKGTTGFVSAYCNYILNILYSSLNASNLALNYVNWLFTFLFPFHLSNQPASLLALVFSSIYFNYWPYCSKFAIAVANLSFVFFI